MTLDEVRRLPALITVEQALDVVPISRGAFYEGIRRGELPSIRIGRRVLIPTAELARQVLGVEVNP